MSSHVAAPLPCTPPQRLRMLPVEFREQLQMALHIYLRPAETTAVAGFFDVDGVGSVNGEHFVRWFLRAGNNSREVTPLSRRNGHTSKYIYSRHNQRGAPSACLYACLSLSLSLVCARAREMPAHLTNRLLTDTAYRPMGRYRNSIFYCRCCCNTKFFIVATAVLHLFSRVVW